MSVLPPLAQNSFEHLLAELRRITAYLSQSLQELSAERPLDDEFRGLYVSEEEIQQLLNDPDLFLARQYKQTQKTTIDPSFSQAATSRLGHLQKVFALTPFETDVILLALAPEIDLRYEKLYAYLQDDMLRRRPGVELALRLLCPGLAGQAVARRCFDPAVPLLKYRLIELSDESQSRQPSLLTRSIKLDEGIVAYLLGDDRLDARLRSVAKLVETAPKDSLLPPEADEYLPRLVAQAARLSAPWQTGFTTVLVGPDAVSQQNLALELCRRLSLPLLVVDTPVLVGWPKLESQLRLLEREARLRKAVLYWSAYESLLADEPTTLREIRRQLTQFLQEATGLCFIASRQPISSLLTDKDRHEFQLSLAMPGYLARQQLWQSQFEPPFVAVNDLDLAGLSSRFRLNSTQIKDAAATARNEAEWRGAAHPTLADLEAACRRHSNQRLSSLARKIAPLYRWSDLVLPSDQFQMLHEICQQVTHRSLVLEEWGFENKLSLGKGLNVVFAGPSGTGKTMSAEIIAGELKMDLYKIDLSSVVSKYIGETEKNLEQIFNEAGESNAILFFDEADSIFGKRSEVKDAHDRYANIETGYLLQKMEEYDGIVILATNLRKNLDDAFVRRMHFMLEFPFPEEADRFEIWRRVFPSALPLAANVDLRFMARQFKLSGGNIKNIALAAAFLAADSPTPTGRAVQMRHLIWATRREFQKMGKLCTEADFGPYFSLLHEIEPKTTPLMAPVH